MRILFLTQWFYPEPFFKGLPFAQELVRRGHEVEVLTGYPNYPGGKLYPGYRIKIIKKEIIRGVNVIRVPLYPSHNRSGILRIVNYLTFSLSSLVLGPFAVKRPDIIYVYNLPTLGFTAAIFRLLFRSKVILDIQDLWPESVTQSQMLQNSWALSFLTYLTNRIYASADHITVLSPGFRGILQARGIPPAKISVIYNWCDEEPSDAGCTTKKELQAIGNNGKINAVFAGNMGKMQALHSIIDAAEILEKKNKDILLWFIGDGIEVSSLKSYAAAKALSNVLFIPRVAQQEIGAVLKKADVLLVHLRKDPLFEVTIPSKIQAYLFAGRPILVGVSGDAANLVEDADAGMVCEPENPSDIAGSILKIASLKPEEINAMGGNGMKYYHEHLSIKAGVNHFEKCFVSQLPNY